MKTDSFAYRPGKSRDAGCVSFEIPRPGDTVSGSTILRVTADFSDADRCIFEYSVGQDSTPREWQMLGVVPKTEGLFVGRWVHDSTVPREEEVSDYPCRLRATVLGQQGQKAEAVMKTVISGPPEPGSSGCGGK